MGRLHLGSTAAAHGHRAGAVVAQGGNQPRKVNGLGVVLDVLQVDEYRVVIKKIRIIGQAAGQVGNHLLDLGAAQSHGQHRQFGAFQVERVDSTGSISGHVYVKRR